MSNEMIENINISSWSKFQMQLGSTAQRHEYDVPWPVGMNEIQRKKEAYVREG